jgi:hypothetical protein
MNEKKNYIRKYRKNGVMLSQSDNVVTFVWPPFHQGIELETRDGSHRDNFGKNL